MQTIRGETWIAAPPERCFDAARAARLRHAALHLADHGVRAAALLSGLDAARRVRSFVHDGTRRESARGNWARRRPAGWPGGVPPPTHPRRRDGAGPAGEDAGAPAAAASSRGQPYFFATVTFTSTSFTSDPLANRTRTAYVPGTALRPAATRRSVDAVLPLSVAAESDSVASNAASFSAVTLTAPVKPPLRAIVYVALALLPVRTLIDA